MASPGAYTYEELVALAKQAMGGRNTGLMTDAWYGDRINAGYARLATFQGPVQAPGMSQPQMRVLRFFELYFTDDRTITSGLSTNLITPVATADKVVCVDNVYDLTNDVHLRRKSRRYIDRRNPQGTGRPREWAPGGDGGAGYYVYPIPGDASDEISVRETTYQYPDELTAGETPVIPAAWHTAIWLAAAAEAALLIDWPEKENEMENRFMRFIAERRSPVEESGAGGGRRYFSVGGRT